MQKQKIGKISIFNSLDVKLKFLMSWIELTQFSVESSWIELKIWATQLELSWKCEQFNFELSRIQNVNLKLNLMISLLLESIHSVVKDSEAKESSDMLIVEEINTFFIMFLMKVSSFLSCYLQKKTFSHSFYSSKWWFHVNERWRLEKQKCWSCSESSFLTSDLKSCKYSR